MTSELFQRLKPFFFMSIILGFMGCKIVSTRLEKSGISGRIWALVVAVAIGVIPFTFVILFLPHDRDNMGPLLQHSKFVKEVLSLLGFLATLFIGNYYQDVIIAFYRGAENYDNRIEILGHKKKNGYWVIWLNFVIECAVTIQRIYVFVYKPPKIAVVIFTQIIFGDTERYMAFYMCLQMYLVLDRFRHLNNVLIPKLFAKYPRQRESFVLCQVKYLHYTIFNMARELNIVYDVAITSWFLQVFLHVGKIGSGGGFTKLPLTHAFSVYSKIFRLIYFIVLCDGVCRESNISGFRVMRERRTSTCVSDNGMWIDAAMYFHHHKVQFTAFDLLHFRLSTLLTIVAGSICLFLLVSHETNRDIPAIADVLAPTPLSQYNTTE